MLCLLPFFSALVRRESEPFLPFLSSAIPPFPVKMAGTVFPAPAVGRFVDQYMGFFRDPSFSHSVACFTSSFFPFLGCSMYVVRGSRRAKEEITLRPCYGAE